MQYSTVVCSVGGVQGGAVEVSANNFRSVHGLETTDFLIAVTKSPAPIKGQESDTRWGCGYPYSLFKSHNLEAPSKIHLKFEFSQFLNQDKLV